MPIYATRTVARLKKFSFFSVTLLVITTDRYIGCKQDLEQPMNDRFNSLLPMGAQSE
jgi:hypothetical protein